MGPRYERQWGLAAGEPVFVFIAEPFEHSLRCVPLLAARQSGVLPHLWCSMLDRAFGGLIDDQPASKTRCRRSW